MLRLAPLFLCLAAGTAQANTIDCGGNSYSFAEVVTAPRAKASKGGSPPAVRRRGPIEVMPDSLCADLIEHRRQAFEPTQMDVEIPLPGGTRPRR